MIAGNLNLPFLIILLVMTVFKADAAQESRDLVHEIERSFAEQMYNEFGLLWNGDMSIIRDKIEEIGMSFLAYRRATIEEARALELLVVDKFVQAVNAHEKIQPYLDISPFSHKRAWISISFQGVNARNSDGSITYISCVSEMAHTSSKNHIIYCSHDPFRDDLIDELKEPYEEALRLNATSPVNPTSHQENDYEGEMDSLLASFKEEVQNEYGINVWSIGGKWINGIEEIGAKFVLKQFVTQAEARQLLVEVTEKLLSTLNSNEKIRPYLKEFPFPASLLKIRLCIEGKYSEQPDVTIIEATLDENLITYDQEILHPKEEGTMFRYAEKSLLATESYPEALKIVKENPVEFKQQIPSISIYENLRNLFTGIMTYIFSASILPLESYDLSTLYSFANF